MKLKLKEVVEGYTVLQIIGLEKMSLRMAFIFQRNIKALQPEFESFEKTRVEAVAKKYGDKKKDGSFEVTDKNKLKEYLSEIGVLLDTEIDVEVTLVNIEDVKDIKVSPNDLMYINWMFSGQENIK
jgi:hypothetical protein